MLYVFEAEAVIQNNGYSMCAKLPYFSFSDFHVCELVFGMRVCFICYTSTSFGGIESMEKCSPQTNKNRHST